MKLFFFSSPYLKQQKGKEGVVWSKARTKPSASTLEAFSPQKWQPQHLSSLSKTSTRNRTFHSKNVIYFLIIPLLSPSNLYPTHQFVCLAWGSSARRFKRRWLQRAVTVRSPHHRWPHQRRRREGKGSCMWRTYHGACQVQLLKLYLASVAL